MGLSAEELKVGDSYSEVVVEDLTRTQIVQYALHQIAKEKAHRSSQCLMQTKRQTSGKGQY